MKSKFWFAFLPISKIGFILSCLFFIQAVQLAAQPTQDFASAEAYAKAIHEEALLCKGVETVIEEIETENYLGARASIKNLEHSFPIVERRIAKMPSSYEGDGQLWQAADELVAYAHQLTKELKEMLARAETSGLSEAMRKTLQSHRSKLAQMIATYEEARSRFIEQHKEKSTAYSLSPEVEEYNEYLNGLRRQTKTWLEKVYEGLPKRLISIPGTVIVSEESLLSWSGRNLRKLEQWDGIPHQELVKPAALEYMRFLRYEFFPWLQEIYEQESEIFGDAAREEKFWREVKSKWTQYAIRHNELSEQFIKAQKAFVRANLMPE